MLIKHQRVDKYSFDSNLTMIVRHASLDSMLLAVTSHLTWYMDIQE